MCWSHGQSCVFLIRNGESNPTYLLEWSNGPRVVLRRKPPGNLLRGAHRVCSCLRLCFVSLVPPPFWACLHLSLVRVCPCHVHYAHYVLMSVNTAVWPALVRIHTVDTTCMYTYVTVLLYRLTESTKWCLLCTLLDFQCRNQFITATALMSLGLSFT